MRKLVLLVALLLIPFSSESRASGDVGCTPDLQAFHKDFTGCENTALIAPSNDTRANLTLLLLDLHDRAGEPLSTPPSFAYGDWPNEDWAWPVDWQNFAALFYAPVPEGQVQPDTTGLETEGEGTVCVSDQAGADGFIKAVGADGGLDDAEKQALTDARKAIHCSPDATLAATPPVLPTLSLHSPAANEFAAYLAAINKFYASDRTDPAGFTALKTAGNAWIKEAATYMEARVKLLSALNSGLSEYGDVDLNKADKATAMAAAEALKGYLASYPAGAYVNSARGLLRRAYWLGGDVAAQLAVYGAQINELDNAVPGIDASTLAEEIDAKLPNAAYRDPKADPLLTAIDLLRRMRPAASDDSDKEQLRASDLDAVKDAFKDKPELFLYLQAALAHFVQHDDKAVLALVPEQHATDKLNYLQFSTAMLRAAASGDAKAYADIISAAGSPLQRACAELAWAMAKERAGQLDEVFDQDSPVTSALIRTRLLEYAAGPGLLRRQTISARVSQSERSLALYTLLYRDLTQGAYKSFLSDVKLVPPSAANAPTPDSKLGSAAPLKDFLWDGKGEGFDCPPLADVSAKLAANPNDARGKLCVGEFLRLATGDDFALATPPAADDLGGAGLKFPGKALVRQDIYMQVMADPKAGTEDKAFALYRAIECYASVGDNHCGGKDVDKSTRKAWFNRLKKEFGNTAWAREAKYYY